MASVFHLTVKLLLSKREMARRLTADGELEGWDFDAIRKILGGTYKSKSFRKLKINSLSSWMKSNPN